jgi:hypothetical protein
VVAGALLQWTVFVVVVVERPAERGAEAVTVANSRKRGGLVEPVKATGWAALDAAAPEVPPYWRTRVTLVLVSDYDVGEVADDFLGAVAAVTVPGDAAAAAWWRCCTN